MARDGSTLAALASVVGGSGIQNLTPTGRALFYTTSTSALRYGLWRTNGRRPGTVRLRKVSFPSDPFEHYEFVGVGNKLFFTTQTAIDGNPELWVTDGTRAGTLLLATRLAENLADVAGALFFSSFDGEANVIWKSDGTPQGTVQVAEIKINPSGFYMAGGFTSVGAHIFFTADDGSHTPTLFVTDGTAAGTRPLVHVSGQVGGRIVDLNGVALLIPRRRANRPFPRGGHYN